MLKMTLATRAVLRALLTDPGREMYGREIGALAELPSGTVTPILRRLTDARWVECRAEEVDTSEAGRPRRNYYKLTSTGEQAARAGNRAYAKLSEETR